MKWCNTYMRALALYMRGWLRYIHSQRLVLRFLSISFFVSEVTSREMRRWTDSKAFYFDDPRRSFLLMTDGAHLCSVYVCLGRASPKKKV